MHQALSKVLYNVNPFHGPAVLLLLPPYCRWLKCLVQLPRWWMLKVGLEAGLSPRASHGLHGLHELFFCLSQLEFGLWYMRLKKFWLIHRATGWVLLLLLAGMGNSGGKSFPFGKSRHSIILLYPGTCWMSSVMSGRFRTISGTCYCCTSKFPLPWWPLVEMSSDGDEPPLSCGLQPWVLKPWRVAINCDVYCKWFMVHDKACTFSNHLYFITVIHALSFTKLIMKTINFLPYSHPLRSSCFELFQLIL